LVTIPARKGKVLGELRRRLATRDYEGARALLAGWDAAVDDPDSVMPAEAHAASRELLGRLLGDWFGMNGMDVRVVVRGESSVLLGLASARVGEVLAGRLSSSGIPQQLRTAGFRILEVTDGVAFTRTWDLDEIASRDGIAVPKPVPD
jgi:hypothetical protein